MNQSHQSKKLHAEFRISDVQDIKFCPYCGCESKLHRGSNQHRERIECDNCNRETLFQKQPKQDTEAMLEYIDRIVHRSKSEVHDLKEHHAKIERRGGVVNKHGGWSLGYYESRQTTLENLKDEIQAGSFE